MDGVDYQHELGQVHSNVYSSLEELKEISSCWKGCGVVKLKIKVIEEQWVEKQDLFNSDNIVKYTPEMKKEEKLFRDKDMVLKPKESFTLEGLNYPDASLFKGVYIKVKNNSKRPMVVKGTKSSIFMRIKDD